MSTKKTTFQKTFYTRDELREIVTSDKKTWKGLYTNEKMKNTLKFKKDSELTHYLNINRQEHHVFKKYGFPFKTIVSFCQIHNKCIDEFLNFKHWITVCPIAQKLHKIKPNKNKTKKSSKPTQPKHPKNASKHTSK